MSCLTASRLNSIGPPPLRTRTRVYREAQTRAPGEHKSLCPVASADGRTTSCVCVSGGGETGPPGRVGDHLGRRLQVRKRSRHLLPPRLRDLRCLVGSPTARARGARPLESEPPELQFLRPQVSERQSRLPPRTSFPRPLSLSAEMQRRRTPNRSAVDDRGGTGCSTGCNCGRPSPLTFRRNAIG